jgi:hypothetical protein
MAGRHSVRFAPKFGSDDEEEQDFQYDFQQVAGRQQSQQQGFDHNDPKTASMQTAAMGGSGFEHPLSKFASNSGASSRKLNTTIAANDGRSLVSALGHSIRYHARLIDGDQQQRGATPVESAAAKRAALVAYDPYQDDDHVSLAPNVELNYEEEAREANKREASSALRLFVANAGVNGTNFTRSSGRSGTAGQPYMASLADNPWSLTNWFVKKENEDAVVKRSVRFLDSEDDFAAAINQGATGRVGGGLNFIAPPPTSFRTATRHPSHLPAEYDTVENRINAPKRILAARRRHRRNDSFLRLVVVLLCFALSLSFAIFFRNGKFGLAITSLAYERKAARYKDDENSKQAMDGVFYPEWWEDEKGIPDMESRGIEFMPTVEYNVAEVTKPIPPGRIETPFFWLVPRSGANAVRTVMSKCLRLAEASEAGAGEEQNFLKVVDDEDKRYVNVDLSTSNGLAHAKELSLASSGVPDVLISGDIHGVLALFNNRNRARLFAVFRHPLDRAISKYYADLASDPEVAGLTLTQYIRQGGQRVQNNYLTRYLSGRYGGKLEVWHLDVAREFMRRKFVVGLARDLPATTNLFINVFGWNNTAATNADLCYHNIFNALSDSSPPSVDEGSEGWKLLVSQNWFDLKVYEYAEHLFQQQIEQLKAKNSLKIETTV